MSWEHLKVSDHFTLGEFACGGSTCNCHGAVQVSQKLVNILEEFRALVGGPLRVTSGFRCDSHNEARGGHPRSFHRVGWAADITSFELRQNLEAWALQLGEIVEDRLGEADGNVIYYPKKGFVHVDVGHRISELVRSME